MMDDFDTTITFEEIGDDYIPTNEEMEKMYEMEKHTEERYITSLESPAFDDDMPF